MKTSASLMQSLSVETRDYEYCITRTSIQKWHMRNLRQLKNKLLLVKTGWRKSWSIKIVNVTVTTYIINFLKLKHKLYPKEYYF